MMHATPASEPSAGGRKRRPLVERAFGTQVDGVKAPARVVDAVLSDRWFLVSVRDPARPLLRAFTCALCAAKFAKSQDDPEVCVLVCMSVQRDCGSGVIVEDVAEIKLDTDIANSDVLIRCRDGTTYLLSHDKEADPLRRAMYMSSVFVASTG